MPWRLGSGIIGRTMQIHHRLAQDGDFAALAQMLELYQYELSDIWPQHLDAQGRYGYDLSRHRQGGAHAAHVCQVDGCYAGFALVAPARFNRAAGCWMEQFFVLRAYRRHGVGAALAGHVLHSHPGPWQVGQMTRNLPAQAFWRQVLGQLCGGRQVETCVTQGGWQGVVQAFDWPPQPAPAGAA